MWHESIMKNKITLKDLESIFMNDLSLVKQMLEVYFNSFEAQYKQIQSNYEIKDLIKLKANLHSLKGMISIFGAMDLLDLLKRLEGLCLQSQNDQIAEEMSQLHAQVSEFNQRLKEIQKELQ